MTDQKEFDTWVDNMDAHDAVVCHKIEVEVWQRIKTEDFIIKSNDEDAKIKNTAEIEKREADLTKDIEAMLGKVCKENDMGVASLTYSTNLKPPVWVWRDKENIPPCIKNLKEILDNLDAGKIDIDTDTQIKLHKMAKETMDEVKGGASFDEAIRKRFPDISKLAKTAKIKRVSEPTKNVKVIELSADKAEAVLAAMKQAGIEI